MATKFSGVQHFKQQIWGRSREILCLWTGLLALEDPAPKAHVSWASTVTDLLKLISTNRQHWFPNQLHSRSARVSPPSPSWLCHWNWEHTEILFRDRINSVEVAWVNRFHMNITLVSHRMLKAVKAQRLKPMLTLKLAVLQVKQKTCLVAPLPRIRGNGEVKASKTSLSFSAPAMVQILRGNISFSLLSSFYCQAKCQVLLQSVFHFFSTNYIKV